MIQRGLAIDGGPIGAQPAVPDQSFIHVRQTEAEGRVYDKVGVEIGQAGSLGAYIWIAEAQIVQARTWPAFDAHRRQIVDAMLADPELTLRAAYVQVMSGEAVAL